MSGIARLTTVILDCPDPRALAEFYSALTGWKIVDGDDEDWIDLSGDAGIQLSFQRATDHQPPRWPDPGHPQQFHLDLEVEDLDETEVKVIAIGATKASVQPGRSFRVFTDPAGHPFCLCVN
ncbi:MAG: VOC family protein [Actinocatenispora sp.]